MASYKLIVKNAKVILKTVTNAVLNITGIRDLLTGSGSVDSNTKIDWTLQHYTNTAANFTSTNPTLLVGQVGIETDDLLTAPKYKIGDGVTAWNTLPYNSSGGGGGGGLSGLTTNKVLKATSSTTAGNSNITDDGTNVGIVTGNSQIYALPTEAGFYYFENNTGIVKVNDSGTYLQHDDLIDLNAPSVTKNGVEVATVNDIPTVDTTIIDGSTNAVSGNAVFDGLATKSGLLLYKINTPIAHTGTTAATVINSYLISSGTVQANDFLKFSLRHAATNNANNKTIKLWANTSNTIVGATQLGVYIYTTNSGGVFWFKRTMFLQNSLTSQRIINATAQSVANDEITYPNNADSTLTLNFANDVWILIEVTLANAADTFILNAFFNEINR